MGLNERGYLILISSVFFGAFYTGIYLKLEKSIVKIVMRTFVLFAFAALFYDFSREYDYPLYRGYFEFIRGSFIYLFLIVLVLNKIASDETDIKTYLKSVPVRVYFLPIMYGFFLDQLSSFSHLSFDTPEKLVLSYSTCVFFIDVVISIMAYALPLSIFGIRQWGVDYSMKGVFFTVVCYPPFWWIIDSRYVGHDDRYSWSSWLSSYPVFSWIWAFFIVMALSLYISAVLSLGFRFSNLIYKGLCDKGVYRYMRHPQYTGKILYYWLIAVPFVSRTGNIKEIIYGILGLSIVSYVYYMRAKTEESFLMQYSEYFKYSSCVPFLPVSISCGHALGVIKWAKMTPSSKPQDLTAL
jgi:protein-S-isoprenylcysteine O-methyltransferase Ste14